MYAHITCCRKFGVPVAPGELSAERVYSGTLKIQDKWVAELKRTSKVAELTDMSLAELNDVVLLYTHAKGFVLTGFERMMDASGRPVDYAQSWYVQLP